MSCFLLVRLVKQGKYEIIPASWFNDGECYWPPKNQEYLVTSYANVKSSWPLCQAQIHSVHSSYKEALDRKEKERDSSQSESAINFIQSESRGGGLRCQGSKRLSKASQQDSQKDIEESRQQEDESDQNAFSSSDESHVVLKNIPKSRGSSRDTPKNCNEVIFDTPRRTDANDAVPSTSGGIQEISETPITRRTVSNRAVLKEARNKGKRLRETSPEKGYSEDEDCDPLEIQFSLSAESPFERKVLQYLSTQNRYLKTVARSNETIIYDLRDQNKMMYRISEELKSKKDLRDMDNEESNVPADDNLSSIPLKSVDEFKAMEQLLMEPGIKRKVIERLRCLGGDSLKDVVKRCWREMMTDDLMIKMTWKGQIKNGSNKCTVAVHGSRLSTTIFDAVKHADHSNVSLKEMEKLSAEYVRRSSDRVASKERSRLRNMERQNQELEEERE